MLKRANAASPIPAAAAGPGSVPFQPAHAGLGLAPPQPAAADGPELSAEDAAQMVWQVLREKEGNPYDAGSKGCLKFLEDIRNFAQMVGPSDSEGQQRIAILTACASTLHELMMFVEWAQLIVDKIDSENQDLLFNSVSFEWFMFVHEFAVAYGLDMPLAPAWVQQEALFGTDDASNDTWFKRFYNACRETAATNTKAVNMGLQAAEVRALQLRTWVRMTAFDDGLIAANAADATLARIRLLAVTEAVLGHPDILWIAWCFPKDRITSPELWPLIVSLYDRVSDVAWPHSVSGEAPPLDAEEIARQAQHQLALDGLAVFFGPAQAAASWRGRSALESMPRGAAPEA
jgi:hypothetical protein